MITRSNSKALARRIKGSRAGTRRREAGTTPTPPTGRRAGLNAAEGRLHAKMALWHLGGRGYERAPPYGVVPWTRPQGSSPPISHPSPPARPPAARADGVSQLSLTRNCHLLPPVILSLSALDVCIYKLYYTYGWCVPAFI